LKKKILFIVANEYHLYSSICMFYNYFNSDEYEFKLILTKRPKNHRILANYQLPFEYYVFDDYLNLQDFRTVKKYPDYEKNLTEIYDLVDELYTYIDFTLIVTKIVNWVKLNPNSKVILVHEGVAGYFKYDFPKLKIIKFFLPYLYLMLIKRVKNIDFVYHWGRYKKVDEIKMIFPESVIPEIPTPRASLDLSINPEISKKIKQIFNFDFDSNPLQKYLLYLPIGEARGSADAKEIEYQLIEKLIHLAAERNLEFILKIKSGVSSLPYTTRYGGKIRIIDAKIPVEIMISDIYNSYIISAFSSAALHYVNQNKYFWIYPLLKFESNLKPFTPHIKLIQEYNELEKCLQ
jgi:hypothetical protein